MNFRRFATEDQSGTYQKWTTALRWTARVWSAASIALVIAFIAGEGLNPSWPNEWIGFLFFPLGVIVGMVVAWRRESLGGGITMGSLSAFYLVHRVTAGTFPQGWAWLAFAAPGFLFLLLSRARRLPGLTRGSFIPRR